MKSVAGRNGGTLKTWEKGESGNPKGRAKGITHWVKELQSKKKFNVSIEMEDEEGEITVVNKSITLKESAAKLMAIQLILRGTQGDMEAIRELTKIDMATLDREALYRSNLPNDNKAPRATPFTIIDPDTNEIISLEIGAANEETA